VQHALKADLRKHLVQCVDCLAGTFSSDIGAISEQTCKDCGKDYTSPVGSSTLSACERKRQQCSVSKTSSGVHIEFEANLPYSASTFTTAVQDKFKVGVAAATRMTLPVCVVWTRSW